MTSAVAGDEITVGKLKLSPGTRLLAGPNGAVTLEARTFAAIELLARRPGALVLRNDLIASLYPDADAEPDHAAVVVRQVVSRLRAVLAALGAGTRTIVVEPGVGYRLNAGIAA